MQAELSTEKRMLQIFHYNPRVYLHVKRKVLMICAWCKACLIKVLCFSVERAQLVLFSFSTLFGPFWSIYNMDIMHAYSRYRVSVVTL